MNKSITLLGILRRFNQLKMKGYARILSLAICLFLLMISQAIAQVTTRLLLMNGKYIDIIELNDTSRTDLTYSFDKNFYKRERAALKEAADAGKAYNPNQSSEFLDKFPRLWVEGSADRGDVFSATPAEGPEKIYYFYDEPLGNYLLENEMRSFIIGERDARYAVKGKGWFYGGMAVGFGAGYALQGSVFTVAVPPVFALAAKIPVVKIKREAILDPTYIGDPNYAAGYESVARSKYFIQGLKGSAIGAFLGLLTYSFVEANN